MRKNQQLVIVLPEGSEELPIRIVRGSRSMELWWRATRQRDLPGKEVCLYLETE